MSKMSRALVCSASLVAISSPAFADNVVTTPAIVMSATRYATPLSEVASSVTIITADQIAQQNKPTVTELLRQVPGVTIANNGGTGQPTSLFMRGTESRHVLVIIDGMVANDPSDPSDRFDFSNLTTDNIERIEVLRGPQSTLYGSQAIGGVIQIFSKQGRGAPKSTALMEYGSRNSRKIALGNYGEIGNTSYSISVGSAHTNGISSLSHKSGGNEHDGNDTHNFASNIATKVNEYFTAKWNARYIHNYTENDSPGVFSTMAPRPADDPAAHNLTRQFNTRFAGELRLFEGVWTQEMGVSTVRTNRAAITSYYDDIQADSPFGRQQFFGTRNKIDWVHHIKTAPNNTVSVGTEISSDEFKTDKLRQVNVDNNSYFVDDQYTWQDFFVNAGARIDDHQAFGKQSTWKLAPGYHIRETGTTLKMTYGTGFKAPSLADLFAPGTGNPNVLPEKSKGYDFGFDQVLWGDKVKFGTTFFRNDITNLITNSELYPFPSINRGKVRTQGVENVIDIRPDMDWTLHASHVYTLSQDRRRDKELLRRPKHQANLGAVYQYSVAGDVGANIRYVDQRRDGDIITFAPVKVKSFATVDLTTNYKLDQNITLYGRVDNLLNKTYEEVAGYGQPGFSVFGGMKLLY